MDSSLFPLHHTMKLTSPVSAKHARQERNHTHLDTNNLRSLFTSNNNNNNDNAVINTSTCLVTATVAACQCPHLMAKLKPIHISQTCVKIHWKWNIDHGKTSSSTVANTMNSAISPNPLADHQQADTIVDPCRHQPPAQLFLEHFLSLCEHWFSVAMFLLTFLFLPMLKTLSVNDKTSSMHK